MAQKTMPQLSWVLPSSLCLQELNATIRKLQDAVAAETNAREQNEIEAQSKAEDFQRQIETLEEEHASAVQEGQSIQSKAHEDVADLSSQLERARSEYSAEQEGRVADNKEAETAANALKATIQKLEDAVAAETNAREKNEREAQSKAEDFQRQIETLEEEHASAVQEGQSIQSKAHEDVADLSSQLERARSEYSAEQEGRVADNKEAETAANALKATIQKLLGFAAGDVIFAYWPVDSSILIHRSWRLSAESSIFCGLNSLSKLVGHQTCVYWVPIRWCPMVS